MAATTMGAEVSDGGHLRQGRASARRWSHRGRRTSRSASSSGRSAARTRSSISDAEGDVGRWRDGDGRASSGAISPIAKQDSSMSFTSTMAVFRRLWVVIIGVWCDAFATAINIPVLQLYMSHEMGLETQDFGLCKTVGGCSQLLGGFAVAYASDFFGRRFLLAFAYAAAGVTQLVLGVTKPSLWIAVGAYAVVGIGGNPKPLAASIVCDVTKPGVDRAFFLGTIGGSFSVAMIVGPLLGAKLSRMFGRRFVVLCAAAAQFAASAFVLFLFTESLPSKTPTALTNPRATKGRVDEDDDLTEGNDAVIRVRNSSHSQSNQPSAVALRDATAASTGGRYYPVTVNRGDGDAKSFVMTAQSTPQSASQCLHSDGVPPSAGSAREDEPLLPRRRLRRQSQEDSAVYNSNQIDGARSGGRLLEVRGQPRSPSRRGHRNKSSWAVILTRAFSDLVISNITSRTAGSGVGAAVPSTAAPLASAHDFYGTAVTTPRARNNNNNDDDDEGRPQMAATTGADVDDDMSFRTPPHRAQTDGTAIVITSVSSSASSSFQFESTHRTQPNKISAAEISNCRLDSHHDKPMVAADGSTTADDILLHQPPSISSSSAWQSPSTQSPPSTFPPLPAGSSIPFSSSSAAPEPSEHIEGASLSSPSSPTYTPPFDAEPSQHEHADHEKQLDRSTLVSLTSSSSSSSSSASMETNDHSARRWAPMEDLSGHLIVAPRGRSQRPSTVDVDEVNKAAARHLNRTTDANELVSVLVARRSDSRTSAATSAYRYSMQESSCSYLNDVTAAMAVSPPPRPSSKNLVKSLPNIVCIGLARLCQVASVQLITTTYAYFVEKQFNFPTQHETADAVSYVIGSSGVVMALCQIYLYQRIFRVTGPFILMYTSLLMIGGGLALTYITSYYNFWLHLVTVDFTYTVGYALCETGMPNLISLFATADRQGLAQGALSFFQSVSKVGSPLFFTWQFQNLGVKYAYFTAATCSIVAIIPLAVAHFLRRKQLRKQMGLPR